MADIHVEPAGDDTFRVTVTETGSSTTHLVTIDPTTARNFDAEALPLVEASFRFLLDREPKESILGSFDLSVISRYFPEYAAKIGDYL